MLPLSRYSIAHMSMGLTSHVSQGLGWDVLLKSGFYFVEKTLVSTIF